MEPKKEDPLRKGKNESLQKHKQTQESWYF